MILVQFLLLLVILVVTMALTRNPYTQRAGAIKRLLMAGFVLLMAVAIIWPNLTNDIAHWLGIGRGADLITYCVTIAFVFVTVTVYLEFRRLHGVIHDLARHIALSEAEQNNGKLRSK